MGACVGSFLNVCIYRFPLNISVVCPRSSCPECSVPIPWFLNIPIISYIGLRGRSVCCKKPIKKMYCLVECLSGVLFVLSFVAYSWPAAICVSIFMCFLIIATCIDLQHLYIPDRISLGGILWVCLMAFIYTLDKGWLETGSLCFLNGLEHLLQICRDVCFSSGFLLFIGLFAEKIFKRESLGMGDIKLIGFIGAFCTWQGALFSLFAGSLLATIVLVPLICIQKKLKIALHGQAQWEAQCSQDPQLAEKEKEGLGLGLHVPFGPWLCLGAVLYILFFKAATAHYFNDILFLIKS